MGGDVLGMRACVVASLTPTPNPRELSSALTQTRETPSGSLFPVAWPTCNSGPCLGSSVVVPPLLSQQPSCQATLQTAFLVGRRHRAFTTMGAMRSADCFGLASRGCARIFIICKKEKKKKSQLKQKLSVMEPIESFGIRQGS